MADIQSIQRAQEALEIAHQISSILDTGLDKETLAILIGLCETGVNPESLAAVVRELRREGAALREAEKQAAQQQQPQGQQGHGQARDGRAGVEGQGVAARGSGGAPLGGSFGAAASGQRRPY